LSVKTFKINIELKVEFNQIITGHIQIAQVPDRHEPDSDGEINYKYVMLQLEQNGYNQWIGLEYKPKTDTLTGLKWIKDFGYST